MEFVNNRILLMWNNGYPTREAEHPPKFIKTIVLQDKGLINNTIVHFTYFHEILILGGDFQNRSTLLLNSGTLTSFAVSKQSKLKDIIWTKLEFR